MYCFLQHVTFDFLSHLENVGECCNVSARTTAVLPPHKEECRNISSFLSLFHSYSLFIFFFIITSSHSQSGRSPHHSLSELRFRPSFVLSPLVQSFQLSQVSTFFLCVGLLFLSFVFPSFFLLAWSGHRFHLSDIAPRLPPPFM